MALWLPGRVLSDARRAFAGRALFPPIPLPSALLLPPLLPPVFTIRNLAENLSYYPSMSQTAQTAPKPWPPSIVCTTGVENLGLLYALLATPSFDEISSADDFTAVHDYVKSQGKADDAGKTTVGLLFWVYTGQIKQHGVLLTVVPGVSVAEVVKRAKANLKEDVIAYEHISA